MTVALTLLLAAAAVAFVLHPVVAGVWAPMASDDRELDDPRHRERTAHPGRERGEGEEEIPRVRPGGRDTRPDSAESDP